MSPPKPSAPFDFVVVGAGSFGSVVANRLSADPATRVLLLEAGPRDDYKWIHVPGGYGRMMFHPELNWRFETEADPGIAGRRNYWPRGKILGGSSALNGLLWVRGQREDFEHWASLGCRGWGWEGVLPHFRATESFADGDPALRGRDGEIGVEAGERHELVDAFLAGARECGIPRAADYNGAEQEGVAYFQINKRQGARQSCSMAFLRPAEKRPNFTVETGARATRLLFEGARCVGLEYEQNGALHEVRAARETILSAGALQPPQLLVLPGIGPAEHLREHGMPVRLDLPGVGENMQDHLQIRLLFRASRPVTNNDLAKSWLGRNSGFTISTLQLRPESRGTVRLGSADPRAAPRMQPNYLARPLDVETSLRGVRRVAAAPSLAACVAGKHAPGRDVQADDEVIHWARSAGATTIFHPAGTCRMGTGPAAVVDERLRVRGVPGLRVADCSVMPMIVSADTNAACIMIGDKCAAMIREDA